MRLAQQPISLEKPVGEEDDSALADFIEDVSAESPFEIASEALRRENIARVLASLPRREREVIEMRYGIVGGRARTLEEVGRAFNITRERVRQIENRTLKKLQTLPRSPAAARGGFPSGQRGGAVNALALPSQVRILPPPLCPQEDPSRRASSSASGVLTSTRRSAPWLRTANDSAGRPRRTTKA
jgi:hypothetical protein